MAFDFLVQLLVNGFIIGLLYGVVAMAFVLIYKSSLVVNFAQGEFLLIGAWACWWLLAQFSLPFYLAFILTLVFLANLFGFIDTTLAESTVFNVIAVIVDVSLFH